MDAQPMLVAVRVAQRIALRRDCVDSGSELVLLNREIQFKVVRWAGVRGSARERTKRTKRHFRGGQAAFAYDDVAV
jgi:hypothetical protein